MKWGVLSIGLLLMCITASAAQQPAANDSAAIKSDSVMRGIVIDLLTKRPQQDVRIQLNTGTIVTTPWDGSFCIADSSFTAATVTKSGYQTRNISRKELSDTVYIVSTNMLLDEVVVTGRKRKLNGIFTPINPTDAALMKAGRNMEFNPLGLISLIAGKLGILPDTEAKARRKKEKKKAIIDNY